ncbi:MAG: flagellar hook-length control protein FliK, partial [Brevinematales bacterium]
DENHSVSQDKEFSSKMFQENQKGVQEKPVVRVVDKRSHSLITEKSLAEGTTIKESFSSKIEHFLKQIEPKDGMVPSFAKPIQDFGLKIAPALPSLPRVSVEQMLQQVVGKAFITLRDGQSEMRLQLTPPDLGRMEMKIILEDGQMMGKIVVSTPEAKALFDQNLGELQRQLQQAGVQVGGLDVSLGQPGSDKNPESVGDFSRLSTQGKGDVITSEEGSSLSLWADARVNYLV